MKGVILSGLWQRTMHRRSAGGNLLSATHSLVSCIAQANFSVGLCVVSFYGLNRLIWEAEKRRRGNVLLRSFDSCLDFPPAAFATARMKWEPVAPMLAACVFKEPCEEGVSTRTPPTSTPHALPGAEALWCVIALCAASEDALTAPEANV